MHPKHCYLGSTGHEVHAGDGSDDSCLFLPDTYYGRNFKVCASMIRGTCGAYFPLLHMHVKTAMDMW
jgi:hypothetical protein